VVAARTAKGRSGSIGGRGGGGSLRVAGGDVKGECGGLEELLVAVGALEWEMSFVLLEMVVHSVLTLLCDATMLTNVEAGRILFISVGHSGRGVAVGGLRINFPVAGGGLRVAPLWRKAR
jgi:hypothetical protein